jgi:hypothetical protein
MGVRRWRRGALLGLVLVVALVAAGCGGGDEEPSGAQGTGDTPRLEGLITPGTLTVGTELPAPPFWIGDDYDSLTGGFEVDFAKEMAKRLGLNTVKFVEMPFAGLVAGQQCPCDINFSQVTITPERDKVVDFTEPYFDANQGVLAKKGTKVANLDDAKKLRWAPPQHHRGLLHLRQDPAGHRGADLRPHHRRLHRPELRPDRRGPARHLHRDRRGREQAGQGRRGHRRVQDRRGLRRRCQPGLQEPWRHSTRSSGP